MRTSIKTLEKLCDWINEATGSPMTPYTQDESGKLRANIGNFHLSHAYGGVSVHRMHNAGGGVTTPIVYGHVSKRECFEALCGFMAGIEFAQQQSEAAK